MSWAIPDVVPIKDKEDIRVQHQTKEHQFYQKLANIGYFKIEFSIYPMFIRKWLANKISSTATY